MNDPAPVRVTLDVLKDARIVTVPPVELKLTHDFAAPRIALVADVLFPAPSVRVSITSVPAIVFFQRKKADETLYVSALLKVIVTVPTRNDVVDLVYVGPAVSNSTALNT